MRYLTLLLAGIVFNFAPVDVFAGDLKVEARLVWGVNGDKGTANCKPADPALAENLHRMFKWKNYFEITNQRASIVLSKSCDLKMSDQCTIQVKNVGESRVEVSCIGQGKPVHKGSYTLIPSQWLIVGGNDKDNTAWFVGLRALDEKPTDVKKAISKN